MRNITVSIDEEIYRLARIRAATLDASVSELVRQYLLAVAVDDLPQYDGDANTDHANTVTQNTAVGRHVQQLYDEALARAEAVAGRPIRGVQELVEFRGQLLKDVAADFQAKGIGINMPSAVNREEMYDRGQARLETTLAAEELEGENSLL